MLSGVDPCDRRRCVDRLTGDHGDRTAGSNRVVGRGQIGRHRPPCPARRISDGEPMSRRPRFDAVGRLPHPDSRLAGCPRGPCEALRAVSGQPRGSRLATYGRVTGLHRPTPRREEPHWTADMAPGPDHAGRPMQGHRPTRRGGPVIGEAEVYDPPTGTRAGRVAWGASAALGSWAGVDRLSARSRMVFAQDWTVLAVARTTAGSPPDHPAT